MSGLIADPSEEWRRLLRFVGWSTEDRTAAGRTVECLLRRAPELAEQTYRYLSSVPETAAILGWETEVDESHLAERRRFFTLWLARTLGLDTSDELARVLFRAGTFHAGQGPRETHVPPEYVAGAMGLVQGALANYMARDRLPGEVIASAMASWSKLLSVHLDLMLLGYRAARELDSGTIRLRVAFYGRVRGLVGRDAIQVGLASGGTVRSVLTRLLGYSPELRSDAMERGWEDHDRAGSLWREVVPRYALRDGWRLLRNGKDVRYWGGLDQELLEGDELAVFPPGR
ncbi:MAG: protoglobin domain-containing protein [Chloroflexota bacterium]